MGDWRAETEAAIEAFVRVAEFAGDPIPRSQLRVDLLPAPHSQPPSLPDGSMAVYAFSWHGEWLKVGKAGTRSGPRYVSHHYIMSAPSTLARSLAADPRMLGVEGFDPAAPSAWIRRETCRVNILMPASRDPKLLALLEAFLHLRLRPRYEGRP